MLRTCISFVVLLTALPLTGHCQLERPSLRDIGFRLYRDGKYLEAESILLSAYKFDLPRLVDAADPAATKTERTLRFGRAACYDKMKMPGAALRLYLNIAADGTGRQHRLKPAPKIEHRIVQMYTQSGQIAELRALLDKFDSEQTRVFKATPKDSRPAESEAALLAGLPYRLLRKIAFADPPVTPSKKTVAFLAAMPEVPKTVKLPATLWTHPNATIRIQLDTGYFELPYEFIKNHFLEKAIAGSAADYKWYTIVSAALQSAKADDPGTTAADIGSNQEVTHYMVQLLLDPQACYYSNKTKQTYTSKEMRHVHEPDDMMKRHTLVAPSGESFKFFFPRSAITVVTK